MAQYQRLADVEVGGPKGRVLTSSIMQVYQDFCKTVDSVRNLGYDIMDVEKKQFEEAWYAFRREVKLLDFRLAALLVKGFEDCATVAASFKFLDSFQVCFLVRSVGGSKCFSRALRLTGVSFAGLGRAPTSFRGPGRAIC